MLFDAFNQIIKYSMSFLHGLKLMSYDNI